MVRELAKRTHLISDINPRINRETALERDLFHTSRLTIENLNETLTDGIAIDMPTLESEGVLYRIEPEKVLELPENLDKQLKLVENGKKKLNNHDRVAS